jgi:hypothetical protein
MKAAKLEKQDCVGAAGGGFVLGKSAACAAVAIASVATDANKNELRLIIHPPILACSHFRSTAKWRANL